MKGPISKAGEDYIPLAPVEQTERLYMGDFPCWTVVGDTVVLPPVLTTDIGEALQLQRAIVHDVPSPINGNLGIVISTDGTKRWHLLPGTRPPQENPATTEGIVGLSEEEVEEILQRIAKTKTKTLAKLFSALTEKVLNRI